MQARLGFRFQIRTRWRAHSESARAITILYPRRKDVILEIARFRSQHSIRIGSKTIRHERGSKKMCRREVRKSAQRNKRRTRARKKERVALCSTRRRERTLNAKSIMSCGSGDGIVPGDAKSSDSKSEDLVLCFSLGVVFVILDFFFRQNLTVPLSCSLVSPKKNRNTPEY